MIKTSTDTRNTFATVVALLLIIYFITNTSSAVSATSLSAIASTTEEIASYEAAQKEPVTIRKIEPIISVQDESSSEVVQGDLKVYTSNKFGYKLQYPKEWQIYEVKNAPYIRVQNADARLWDSFSQAERKSYFKIEIVKLPRNNLSLSSWVEKQNSFSVYTPPKIISQENIEIDGYRAIYQLEQLHTGSVHPVVFIEKWNDVYLINIASSHKSYEKAVEEFLSSFRFN